MAKYECINVHIDGPRATIEFNRPEKKNCMSPTLHNNMRHALVEVEQAKVKALVVTGVGNAFCAGMDLEGCFLEPFDDPERWAEIEDDCFTWTKHLKRFPAATIAKVNGWCFGGGMALAGVCDIAIAAEESVWGLSEINFGIFPAGGTTWAYSRNIPARKKALYYALTGETFTGKEAEALGYATKAVPLARLDEETRKVVDMITSKGRTVLRKVKEAYEGALTLNLEDSIAWEMAKIWELSRETKNDWVRTALNSFRRREYKPGMKPYKLTRDV